MTSAHVAEFEAQGCLVLPKLFEREIEGIEQGFEAAFATSDWVVVRSDNYDAAATGYPGFPRLMVPLLLERSTQLTWLRGDPRVTSIAASLLGPNAVFESSDGNLFNGDTLWHHDGFWTSSGRRIRFMLYLDQVSRGTGGLRVIPGSHRDGKLRTALLNELTRRPKPRVWGIHPDQLPARALEVEPGDLIVLDFHTFHASFGGGVRRRLVSLDFGPPGSRLTDVKRQLVETATRTATPDEVQHLRRELSRRTDP